MSHKLVIMVPGHAHPLPQGDGRLLPAATAQAEQWAFGDWLFVGCHQGEAGLLAQHIEEGVKRAQAQGAFLVFSGGKTRKPFVGDLTEAETHKDYALARAGLTPDSPRFRLEKFARDSVENLIFTLALLVQEDEFRDDPGKIRLAVVGWKFKEQRFLLHAAALRVWLMARNIFLPRDWFEYVGVNDPPRLVGGEARLHEALKTDLLLLSEDEKRQSRDRLNGPPYPAVGPILPDLDLLCRQARDHGS